MIRRIAIKNRDKQTIFIFLFLLLLTAALTAFSAGDAQAATSQISRSETIEKELDCTRQRLTQNGEIAWENICYVFGENRPEQESRQETINQALDEMAECLQTTDCPPEKSELKIASPEKQLPEELEPISLSSVSTEEREAREDFKDSLKGRPKEDSVRDVPAIKAKNERVEISGEAYHFQYQEPIFNLTDEGMMYGVYGAYTVRPQKSGELFSDIADMYKVEGRFASGDVDYESQSSGTSDNIPDYSFELRGILGKDYDWTRQTRITPFAGIGFRYLNDDSSGKRTSTGAFGYERESRYLYIPAGAELTRQMSDHWSMNLTAEYDFFTWGSQDSHLSDVSSGYSDLENKQKKGFGMRGVFRLTREEENINFYVEPFVRYWHIRDSETSTAVGSVFTVTGYEPENETTELGVRLGLHY